MEASRSREARAKKKTVPSATQAAKAIQDGAAMKAGMPGTHNSTMNPADNSAPSAA